MSTASYLPADQLARALALRDLTDPDQGEHAVQVLLGGVVDALSSHWASTVRLVRESPIVPVRENYDRLGYAADDVTRAQRYTRYLSPTVMLRSHTSAMLPTALDAYGGRVGRHDTRDDSPADEATDGAAGPAGSRGAAGPAGGRAADPVDELLVAPGLVYRRDVVDRSHVGEPHQVDLWRIRNAPTSDDDMLTMIGLVADAVLPGAEWTTTPATHPYTIGGRQIDVLHNGEWLELAECGRIHPEVLRGSGLDPDLWSGLALGMGLERALMLRKGIPDIRYLRASDPRISAQMRTLDPWQHVSPLPASRRDISVVIGADEDEETLGDRVRTALGDDADVVESVEVLGRTAYADLPDKARERLRIDPDQVNLLVRIVLRPIDRTLTSDEANALRNTIYRAVHEGPVLELV